MLDDISTFEQVRIAIGIARELVSLGREAKSKGLEAAHAERLNNAIIDMQAAVLEAQSDAITSQQAHSRQNARIAEIEQAVSNFQDWETEKARYALVNTGTGNYDGVFVYLLRSESAQGEPPHYICPRCFEQRIKSILQRD